MNPMAAQWIIALLVGTILGWIASEIWSGRALNVAANLIVGVVGALIGVRVFGWLGLPAIGVVGAAALAFLTSAVFLIVVNVLVPRAANRAD